MRILVFGDISDWNIENFSIEKIKPKIIKEIRSADYVIYNLEGPIRKKDKKYHLQLRENALNDWYFKFLLGITGRNQPVVSSTEKILDLLKLNKNTIVTLANNHIKDLGLEGFKHTIKTLKDNGIKYVGAGMNNKEASRDLLFDNWALINCNLVGSEKYGIYWKIYNATDSGYGASFQRYEVLKRKVKNHHMKGKKVLLIIHGGKEMPKNKNLGVDLKKLKELNADYTVVHHFHRYVRTNYEKNNMFCLGDFIFYRPGNLPLNRKSCYLEGNKLKYFKVGDVYDYE